MQDELSRMKEAVNSQGIPDISKLAQYREMEEWQKARSKAAGKAEEVVTIARSIVIEHPEFDVEEALNLAEKFHTLASKRVELLMQGYQEEDKPESAGLATLS